MDIIPTSSIILVAVVPQPRDLEIARVLGWYRIPLRYAPKIIDVDYLALYQPTLFGKGHACQVEFVAEVKGNELTTRQELFREEKDHPRAKEEYYKIQLGSLTHLPHPIKAGKWKRLTFLYTLGEMFRTAKSMDDLILKSEHRQLLWRTLKERVDQKNHYHSNHNETVEIDPQILALLMGPLQIDESQAQYMD
jgi:hypothetical protein